MAIIQFHARPFFEDQRVAELGFASASYFWKGIFEPIIKTDSLLDFVWLGLVFIEGCAHAPVHPGGSGRPVEVSRWEPDRKTTAVGVPSEYIAQQLTQRFWDETVKLRGTKAFTVPTEWKLKIENPKWKAWGLTIRTGDQNIPKVTMQNQHAKRERGS